MIEHALDETGTMTVSLRVNGVQRDVEAETDDTLLTTLREDLGFTSVRGTCGIGVCGSCTVLVDGQVTSSCIMLTAQVHDRDVTTAEGLCGPDGELSAVQQAFVDHGAYQCSFCIPAMTLTVSAALADPEVGRDPAAVRDYLAGNLCRCGTYPQILAAVHELVDEARAERLEGSRS